MTGLFFLQKEKEQASVRILRTQLNGFDEGGVAVEAEKVEPKHLDGEPRVVIYQSMPGGKWHGFIEVFKANPYTLPDGGWWVSERDLGNYATTTPMPPGWAPTELSNVDKDQLVQDMQTAADAAWQEVLNEQHQKDTTEQVYMQLPPSGSQKRIV